MSAHFLADPLEESERRLLAERLQLVTVHAGALVAHLRPAVSPLSERLAEVEVGSVLAALENALVGAVPADGLRVARGRGRPGIQVDADVLHQTLLLLVAAIASDETVKGRIRVTSKAEGARVCVAIADDGARISAPTSIHSRLQGRELALALAEDGIGRIGGRLRVAPRQRGNQVEVWLPVARKRSVARRLPAARAGRRRP